MSRAWRAKRAVAVREAAADKLRSLLDRTGDVFTVHQGFPSQHVWTVVEVDEPISVAGLRSWVERGWIILDPDSPPTLRRYYRSDSFDAPQAH